MIPIQMELGGKDACIVCEDADIELAAKNIVKVPVLLSQLLGALDRLMPCIQPADPYAVQFASGSVVALYCRLC